MYANLFEKIIRNKWYLTPGQALDKVSPTRCPRQGVPDPSFRCKHRGNLPNGSQACLTAVRVNQTLSSAEASAKVDLIKKPNSLKFRPAHSGG